VSDTANESRKEGEHELTQTVNRDCHAQCGGLRLKCICYVKLYFTAVYVLSTNISKNSSVYTLG